MRRTAIDERIDGAGHTWPGGAARLLLRLFLGPISQEINATDEIWQFYQRHAGAVQRAL